MRRCFEGCPQRDQIGGGTGSSSRRRVSDSGVTSRMGSWMSSMKGTWTCSANAIVDKRKTATAMPKYILDVLIVVLVFYCLILGSGGGEREDPSLSKAGARKRAEQDMHAYLISH